MRLRFWSVLAASLATLTIQPSPASSQVVDTTGVVEAPAGPGAPVSPDSADRLRAALELPPGEPPFDLLDGLSLPLRVAAFPIALASEAVQTLLRLRFQPGPPDPVLSALQSAGDWGLAMRLGGFGPRSGAGVGARLHRWDPFFAESGISIRGSQRHALGLATEADRWEIRFEGAWRRYAEPHFWRIGPESPEEEVGDYRWDRTSVAAEGAYRTGPVRWSASTGWEENDVGRGSDRHEPDLQDVVDPDSLFGLVEPTRYARLGGRVALDLTRTHGLQPRGFRAELGGTRFLGVAGTDSDFLRWEGELVGYLPLDRYQQLALRGIAALHRAEAGRGMPFTHLATLGGSRSLRGYERGRFRDRDMVAIQSEWRYEIWRSKHDEARTEGLLFLDVGGVAERLDRLEGSDLRTAYGFGMRGVVRGRLAVLWYVALGGEETQFRVGFSWPY